MCNKTIITFVILCIYPNFELLKQTQGKVEVFLLMYNKVIINLNFDDINEDVVGNYNVGVSLLSYQS